MGGLDTGVVPEGLGGLCQGTFRRPGTGAQILDRVHAPGRLEQSPSGEAPGRSDHLHLEGLRRQLQAQGDDPGRVGIRTPVRAAHHPQGVGADSAVWTFGPPRSRRAVSVVPVAVGSQGWTVTGAETDSPSPSASGGSTGSDQSPGGLDRTPSPVELKSASVSRMGICVLSVLISLLVASGEMGSFASSQAVPPTAVMVKDHCPACGVGHLQTIWQAGRPGRVERQRIAILDSS